MNAMLFLFSAATRPSDEDLARSIRESWSSGPNPVVLLIILGLAVAVTASLLYVRYRTAPTSAALRLFHTLAKSIGVPLRDRALLARIARQQSLPTPLTLLLSPRTMRHHAAGFAKDLPQRKKARVLGRIARIRRAVFA